MTTGIRSDTSGTFGALTFGGDDAVTFDATGIQAGSYKPGSIVAADFADGALIENAPAGLGYGSGAGGTVTQATSKSTPVTLNKPCGQITMNAASLASGGVVEFQLFNTTIAHKDVVLVSFAQAAGIFGGSYLVWAVPAIAAGSVYIELLNRTGGALAEAVVLNFAVIKGAVS